jgi:hypothetical protein
MTDKTEAAYLEFELSLDQIISSPLLPLFLGNFAILFLFFGTIPLANI